MVDNEEIELIKYVSQYVFTVNGKDKTAFRKLNTRKPRDLGNLSGYTKRNGIEIFSDPAMESARVFYATAEKYGFNASNTRKNRFVITIIDTFSKEYVGTFVDLNNDSENSIQDVFSSYYDATDPSKKRAGFDVLVGDAISRYKRNDTEAIEAYASYRRSAEVRRRGQILRGQGIHPFDVF